MLILDEVDGMSAGDRGGIGAMNALIKKTKVCDVVVPAMHTFSYETRSPSYASPMIERYRR